MKIIILSFIILIQTFFCLNNIYGQLQFNKDWDYRYGGSQSEILKSFQKTSDGGFLLSGISNSPIGGDKSESNWDPSLYTVDYWILKLDSLGMKQWDKRFGGTGNDELQIVVQTNDKGYLLGGWSESGQNGNKTQPTRDTSAGYKGDYWIVKTDSLGNKQWDKVYGGKLLDRLYGIEKTTEGGFILVGFSNSDIGGDKSQNLYGTDDYWVIKIDSSGNIIWDKDFGGNAGDHPFSICATSDGNFLIGGFSGSNISGNKSQNVIGQTDYWIVKIDSAGNILWDKDYGGLNEDELHYLIKSNNNGYLLGGWSTSDSSGNKTQNKWGITDYWIVKIDSLGNKQWDIDLGGNIKQDEFGNLFQTNDGGYLVSGTSYSNQSGNKGENNLGAEQGWTIKLSQNGIIEWDKTLFTDGHDESAFSIPLNDKCFVFANETNSGIAGYKSQVSSYYDFWIIKYCDTTQIIESNYELNSKYLISIYPNPAGKFINYHSEVDNLNVVIYNIIGEIVLTTKINNYDGKLDLNLIPGSYIFSYSNNQGTFFQKLIIY